MLKKFYMKFDVSVPQDSLIISLVSIVIPLRVLLSALDTVECDTPAIRTISFIVATIYLSFYLV